MKKALPFLSAILAGAALPAALAPFNFWPLAWLSPALFFWLLSRNTLSVRHSIALGWSYGLGVFGAGVSWVFVSISEHSTTPLPVALLLTGAFVAALALLFAIQGGLYGRYLNGSRYSWLAFAGLWWLFEWLRSWLLTGFPWLYLGYASLDTPLQAWAPLGGVWLLSLWVALGGSALVALSRRRSGRMARMVAAVVLTLPWLVATQLPTQWTEPQRTLSVAVVQADIPQAIKWQRSQLPGILQRYQRLTAQVEQEQPGTELIVWPETAIPALYRNALPYLGDTFARLDEQGISLISGMPAAIADPEQPGGYRFHNSLAVVSGGAGIYHKQRLVPFGEYLPLEAVIRGLVDFFNLPASNFSLPAAGQQNLRINGTELASAICYEIAYPALVREAARSANMLLTVSNDTWFGHSIAPDQHMQIARMRALENGRWLIRGTNNGISALVDPQGNITAQAPRYTVALLTGEVTSMQGQTPWQQLGVWPSLLLAGALMLGSFRRRHITVQDTPFARV
ncbi:MAG: apolipoprotein N-acyltransferase [Marinobacterium sp.]|nr:apolipoprotein N-acyltransferase [Marinobacterium sp.]